MEQNGTKKGVGVKWNNNNQRLRPAFWYSCPIFQSVFSAVHAPHSTDHALLSQAIEPKTRTPNSKRESDVHQSASCCASLRQIQPQSFASIGVHSRFRARSDLLIPHSALRTPHWGGNARQSTPIHANQKVRLAGIPLSQPVFV